jgi:phosphoribosylanthranilate isomerase
MIVQIYEVSTPAEVRALSAMGVDHIGVLVGEGSFPREQTIEKALEIFAAIPAGSKGSALSLSHDVDFIVELTAALLPDVLHLGAAPQHLSHAQLHTVKAKFPKVSLMRSIPVVDESSIALARSYDGIADWLLLDSYESGDRQIGALGVTHSWELDRRIIESVRIPTVIAGGLGPENVEDAIRVARPAGVDSKTKTDKSDGSHTKDLQKVSAFVNAARGANGYSAL